MTILWTIYGPEYGQPGTINLYGPEYDQPVFVWDGNPGALYHVNSYQVKLSVGHDMFERTT